MTPQAPPATTRQITHQKESSGMNQPANSPSELLQRFPDLPAFVSVDIETAGPVPSMYSILSIGACLVSDPAVGFYVELQPEHPDADPHALAISGLSLGELARDGLPAQAAMQQFDRWLDEHIPVGYKPVFVAFNAPFDWMFVSDYFHRHLGRNPFGHYALDIKAFYMGQTGVRLSETAFSKISARYLGNRKLTHNALADARDQAEIFYRLLQESPSRSD